MFGSKEYYTCRGPEAGVPLSCCAAARSPRCPRVAGGRGLGEEAREVERPSSKEAQKTVLELGLLLRLKWNPFGF